MKYLDHLFEQSLDDLLNTQQEELDRRRYYAKTLLHCLDSVLSMKIKLRHTDNKKEVTSW